MFWNVRHGAPSINKDGGAGLSLQKHHHRSEHWIGVRGATRVTVNKQIKIDHENESIYIPIGAATHRLENPGKIPLELIEVHTGSYLGEETTSSALRMTTSGVNGRILTPRILYQRLN